MMKVCIYCSSRNDGDITFHKIPSDKERRQKWLNAMKLPEEKIDKKSYLCSKHFENSTFCCQIVNKVVHRFLHIDAVPSIFTENHSTKENENSSERLFSISNKKEEDEEKEEEDCYFYKIENGIIKRYFQNNLKHPDSLLRSQEYFHKLNEKILSENLIAESVKSKKKLSIEDTQYVASSKEINFQAPVKVEVLPNFQIRNEEIYLKDNICDLKLNDFHHYNGSDITIDAEDIPFDQIEFSNVNKINEVELITCESESLKINEQETTSILENVDIKTMKKKVDNLCNGNVVNSSTKEIKKEYGNIATKDHIVKKNFETQDNNIKNLLYEYLEKNKGCEMNIMVKKYTELTLTELFKSVLNYIERLEKKLEVSAEQNKLYENQIKELEKLLK